MDLLKLALRPFRYIYDFLELSIFRLLILFIAWIAVGFVLYSNGGIISIAGDLSNGASNLLLEAIIAIASILGTAITALVVWIYLKSGAAEDAMTSHAFSDDPSNTYHVPK